MCDVTHHSIQRGDGAAFESSPLLEGGSGFPTHVLPKVAIPKGQSSVLVSIFNLCHTIIGAGILTLPYACRCLGYGTFLIFLALMGALSCFTLCVIVRCADRLRDFSFKGIAQAAFGKWGGIVTEVTIAVYGLGAAISFAVILGSYTVIIFQEWLPGTILTQRPFWVLLFAVFGSALSLNFEDALLPSKIRPTELCSEPPLSPLRICRWDCLRPLCRCCCHCTVCSIPSPPSHRSLCRASRGQPLHLSFPHTATLLHPPLPPLYSVFDPYLVKPLAPADVPVLFNNDFSLVEPRARRASGREGDAGGGERVCVEGGEGREGEGRDGEERRKAVHRVAWLLTLYTRWRWGRAVFCGDAAPLFRLRRTCPLSAPALAYCCGFGALGNMFVVVAPDKMWRRGPPPSRSPSLPVSQYNITTLYRELRAPSVRRMDFVCGVSSVIVAASYGAMACAGYATFGRNTPTNVLDGSARVGPPTHPRRLQDHSGSESSLSTIDYLVHSCTLRPSLAISPGALIRRPALLPRYLSRYVSRVATEATRPVLELRSSHQKIPSTVAFVSRWFTVRREYSWACVVFPNGLPCAVTGETP